MRFTTFQNESQWFEDLPRSLNVPVYIPIFKETGKKRQNDSFPEDILRVLQVSTRELVHFPLLRTAGLPIQFGNLKRALSNTRAAISKDPLSTPVSSQYEHTSPAASFMLFVTFCNTLVPLWTAGGKTTTVN